MRRSALVRYEILVCLALIIIILAYFFAGSGGSGRVCLEADCFNVSVSSSRFELVRGLMGVEHLGANEGMLFVFGADGVYPFWMKDTLIPLDIIWMDSDGRVVFINRNAQSCAASCSLIDPGVTARFVLEVNAGTSESIGLGVGDLLTIEYKGQAAIN
jgi:uncharacterized protein